ncbi:Bug family tripartite tricarboxylate transporter substrate binding protein [Polaromonas sp.]|uniref:Bug family tripartite tricarboxylate transporter substrate binding protein n=1 Tax=Polaromonas sp. TaxID=1869339 RepID=UPI003567558E
MHPINLRRNTLRQTLGLFVSSLLAFTACSSWAEAFPNRPVKILIGNPPGGTSDLLARMIGTELSRLWQQPVIVENMAGASGSIAMNAVVRSAPDGHTLGLLILNHVVFEGLAKKPPYLLAKDVTPLVALARQSNVLVVGPNLPVKTAADLVSYAKAQRTPIAFASGGPGSPSHLAGELFKLQTGVDMLHVPYRGSGPAIQDVIAGSVTLMFAAAPSALPQIKGGTLRGIAVTGETRSAQTPDLPTLKESGFNVVVRDWQGLVGPAGVPADVVKKVNADVRQILAMPGVAARIATAGGETIGGTPEEFSTLVREESVKWKRVIDDAKITAN